MSGYGWNLRHGRLGSSQRPSLPSQIACRICDHVFLSTEALIDHIEAHMAEAGSSSRTRRELGGNVMSTSQGDSFTTCPFQLNNIPKSQTQPFQNGSTLLPLQERTPILGITYPQPQPRPRPPSDPQPQVRVMNNNNHRAVAGSQERVPFKIPKRDRPMEEPLISDCTEPFLQQLERPLPLKVVKKNKSHVEMLDLTLKL